MHKAARVIIRVGKFLQESSFPPGVFEAGTAGAALALARSGNPHPGSARPRLGPWRDRSASMVFMPHSSTLRPAEAVSRLFKPSSRIPTPAIERSHGMDANRCQLSTVPAARRLAAHGRRSHAADVLRTDQAACCLRCPRARTRFAPCSSSSGWPRTVISVRPAPPAHATKREYLTTLPQGSLCLFPLQLNIQVDPADSLNVHGAKPR